MMTIWYMGSVRGVAIFEMLCALVSLQHLPPGGVSSTKEIPAGPKGRHKTVQMGGDQVGRHTKAGETPALRRRLQV